MSIQSPTSLAVDIGGTKVAVALIDCAGKIVGECHQFPVPFNSQTTADTPRMIEFIRPFVDQAIRLNQNLLGLGVSVCGPVDADTGVVLMAPNLHWHYVPLGEMMQKAFGLPVHVSVDARQAALAEHTWGAARGLRNFAWCTVGTGYGGYLYLEDRLYSGSHSSAGNFGHITMDEINGHPCGCGRRGCFETYVAGPAIARQGQQAAEDGRSPMLVQMAAGSPVTTRMVCQASQAGDPAAAAIIEQVIRLISINLGGVVNLLDLDMIVMGGGVVHSSPDFVDRIQARIRDFLMTDEAKQDLKVVKETFSNAPLVGSAADFFIKERIPLIDNSDKI
jgi:glucokinase